MASTVNHQFKYWTHITSFKCNMFGSVLVCGHSFIPPSLDHSSFSSLFATSFLPLRPLFYSLGSHWSHSIWVPIGDNPKQSGHLDPSAPFFFPSFSVSLSTTTQMTISPLPFNVPLVQSPSRHYFTNPQTVSPQHIIRLTLLPFAPKRLSRDTNLSVRSDDFHTRFAKQRDSVPLKRGDSTKLRPICGLYLTGERREKKAKWKLCGLSFVFTPKISSAFSYFPKWITLRRRLQLNIIRWDIYNSIHNRLEVESTLILPLLFSGVYTTIFCWRKYRQQTDNNIRIETHQPDRRIRYPEGRHGIDWRNPSIRV